jgi:hypothetical protein
MITQSIWLQFIAGAGHFSLFHNIQTTSSSNSTVCSVSTGRYYPRYKEAAADNLHRIQRLTICGIVTPLVLNSSTTKYMGTGKTILLTFNQTTNLILVYFVNKFPTFTETDSSAPHSQNSATGPCSDAVQFRPHP